jgi:hypothetical protein
MKFHFKRSLRLLPFLLFALVVQHSGTAAAGTPINLVRTPDDGIQPQAAVDSKGRVHLIYFKGHPMSGDIFYVQLDATGKASTTPVRVNSQPGSAVATGWIRGAQLAIGKNDRVHVVWNGSRTAEPKGPGGNPMLYTRLSGDGASFEPQRNLITWAGGIDGGGTVTADPAGNVYVFWHALAEATDEAGRAVFMARSTDDGQTFAREVKANPQPTGACGCCGMKAFIDAQGRLYVLYRAAVNRVDRDTVLLVSRDQGKTFSSSTLARWQLDACPMTTYAMTQRAPAAPVLATWKNKEQVYLGALTPDQNNRPALITPPGTGDNRKFQVVATNTNDDMLFAWIEDTAWGRGGSLHWQVFDKTGQPTEEKGQANGVPVWSLVTAYSQPDGSFALIY